MSRSRGHVAPATPAALSVDVERREFNYNIEKITKELMKVDLDGLNKFTEDCEQVLDDFQEALGIFLRALLPVLRVRQDWPFGQASQHSSACIDGRCSFREQERIMQSQHMFMCLVW